MKRFHLHVSVKNLDESIRFYPILGFQVDSDEELRGMHEQLEAADRRLIQEDAQPCPVSAVRVSKWLRA